MEVSKKRRLAPIKDKFRMECPVVLVMFMATAPSSLSPGYKQVEAFGPEEEYEDEEEVF